MSGVNEQSVWEIGVADETFHFGSSTDSVHSFSRELREEWKRGGFGYADADSDEGVDGFAELGLRCAYPVGSGSQSRRDYCDGRGLVVRRGLESCQ